jgi:hypothetical protein
LRRSVVVWPHRIVDKGVLPRIISVVAKREVALVSGVLFALYRDQALNDLPHCWKANNMDCRDQIQ